MNDLALEQSKNQLAPVGLSDPLEAYADSIAPVLIIGKLLRFSKGDYLAGEAGDEVSAGTMLTANLDELMAGWIKWVDGKPAEHRMVRVADGRSPPKRAEFGDDDQEKWETDANGAPRDPWQFTNYLPMLSEAGDLYTFTTSSRGGLNAIAYLARRYVNHRRRHPDVFPKVTLGVGSYQHANKEFGRIKFPEFAPAGYAPKTLFYDALSAAGFMVPEAAPAAIESKTTDEFSDEVPF